LARMRIRTSGQTARSCATIGRAIARVTQWPDAGSRTTDALPRR
jgi:hypothetical protein